VARPSVGDVAVLAGIEVIQSNSVGTYTQGEHDAWLTRSCPHCGSAQLLVVGRVRSAVQYRRGGGMSYGAVDGVQWMRCVKCLKGSVANHGNVSPAPKPLREPLGLPVADQTLWEEARVCLAAGANVAAAMVCRKLLLHVAVAHGLPAKNDKGWAPNFAQAIAHLEAEGLITRKMRPWVDRIKEVGNDATHEVTAVSAEQALDVATFMEQLLVLAYELDAKRDASAGE